MPDTYPFRFEKGSKKGTCPQCGYTHKFRYYEDSQGNRLDDYGRCERTNACGYHAWPTGTAMPKTETTYTPPPTPVQIYPAGPVLSRLQETLVNQDSPFHTYALSIGLTHAHLAAWRVGSERLFEKPFTVFVHQDSDGRIVNAKWFQYGPDGKRIKAKTETEMDSFSLKQPDEKELQRYGLCLFGEHLLDPARMKAVFIVESEKTAIISAWFYPQYDWVAVGSANGLTDAKIPPLFNRRVYWLADADGNETRLSPHTKKEIRTEGGRKNSSIRKLQAYQLRHGVIDLFPSRKDGYDLADAIRDAGGNQANLPELLDEHQRHLIAAQNAPVDEPTQGEAGDQPTSQETGDNEADVDWENQVGLPTSIWYNKEHRKHFKDYGFIEYKNAYWFATKREAENDDTWVFKAVSNFIIKPLLLILSKSNPKRIYEVTNTYQSSKVVDLEPKQFANPLGFSEVVESLGNFIFWGAKSHFTRIKMKLFELSKEAEEIKTLGYHSDGFYAFANGIQNENWIPLDEHGHGIVQHADKRYFLPALSKIFASDDQEYQTQKQFIYKPGTISFPAYAQTFCDIYSLNGNGRIGLLFYITCLFRDIVFQNFRFFPHLYLFGPPQSGKSTLAWSTMYLFGEPRMPFMLNTGTAVAFYKQFAEFRNAVVWFDEYQNSIDYARVQSLKTAYDGAGHTKSDNTRDNRNKSIPVHSGCIVSGQELPTADVALFTRCILLQFTKTEFTVEEKQLHADFKRVVEETGVSHLTAQITQFRAHFKEHFLSAFDGEFALIKKHFDVRGIDDRITKNMAILLATYQVLKDKLTFPFNQDQLRQTAYGIMSVQNGLITGSKETSIFWKMVMFMYRQRQIKERLDYRLELKPYLDLDVPKGSPDLRTNLIDAENPSGKRILFIRLQNMHTNYEKLSRERGNKSMDEGSLRHYLATQKGFLGKVRGIKFGKISTTALAFDYDYLTLSIEDFSLDDFVDDENNPPDLLTEEEANKEIGF